MCLAFGRAHFFRVMICNKNFRETHVCESPENYVIPCCLFLNKCGVVCPLQEVVNGNIKIIGKCNKGCVIGFTCAVFISAYTVLVHNDAVDPAYTDSFDDMFQRLINAFGSLVTIVLMSIFMPVFLMALLG